MIRAPDRFLTRWRLDERGTSALEFAAVSIPLFLFMFGIVEYGGYIWAQQALENAATQTARCAGLQVTQRAAISGSPNYETSVCPYASSPPTGTASLYPQGSTILCGCADSSGFNSANAQNFAVSIAKQKWGVTIATSDVNVQQSQSCGTSSSTFYQVNITHTYTPLTNLIPLMNNKTISAQACYPM
jgi:Flp pilus assembly protein TadG